MESLRGLPTDCPPWQTSGGYDPAGVVPGGLPTLGSQGTRIRGTRISAPLASFSMELVILNKFKIINDFISIVKEMLWV